MNIRKLAVVGGLAAAAATLALAPTAAADPGLIDFADIRDAQISSMNFLFGIDAALAGVGTQIVEHPGGFDTVLLDDPPQSAGLIFDYLIFGLSPDKNASVDDPGADNLLNGATVEFANAFNVLLYAALNDGELIGAGDLFGTDKVVDAAIGGDDATVFSAFGVFAEAGLSDVAGYFDPSGLFG